MKHIKTFESFLNEGKSWDNLDPEKLVKQFLGDYGTPQKDATAEDLFSWLNDYAMFKRIEAGTPVSLVNDMVEILQDEGYKGITAKDVIDIAPQTFEEDEDANESEKLDEIAGARERMKEADKQSLAYWTQYAADTSSHKTEAWKNEEAKTVSAVVSLIDKCLDYWNEEADSDNKIPRSLERSIEGLAMAYFKQFKTINGNIVTAMIAQS